MTNESQLLFSCRTRFNELWRCLPKENSYAKRASTFCLRNTTSLHNIQYILLEHTRRTFFGLTIDSEQESGCSAFTLRFAGKVMVGMVDLKVGMVGMAALKRSDLIVLTASSTSSPSVKMPSRIVSRVQLPFSGIMVIKLVMVERVGHYWRGGQVVQLVSFLGAGTH